MGRKENFDSEAQVVDLASRRKHVARREELHSGLHDLAESLSSMHGPNARAHIQKWYSTKAQLEAVVGKPVLHEDTMKCLMCGKSFT